ncbi:MAG: hypothetical protein K2Y22_07440 [Candidatus Obscuribacterales bacterium]|nr:hypothetical protein [Candidatus Obscuribacterales bacterium]
MNKADFKEIWGQGQQDSVRTLLSRAVDRVRSIAGHTAIDVYSEERVKIIWDSVWLNIDCDPQGFWIHAPKDLVGADIDSWNKALESFHKEIIEPIKDQIGGVSTGIGFK